MLLRLVPLAWRCFCLLACLAFLPAANGLDWHSQQGFRWAELPISHPGKTGFTLLSPESTGLRFTNALDEATGASNRVLYNGSGVAVGDYNNDGLPDIFLCNLEGHNALFRNLGRWHFQDVTAEAGLSAPLPLTRGAVFADVNGDGHLDLLISVTGRGVLCYLNNGRGHFADPFTVTAGSVRLGSTTLALADVDGNGTLDLYVANYRPDDIRDRGRASITMVNGRPVMAGAETNRFVFLKGRLEECGQPDQLFLNDGASHFQPVSWTDGSFQDEAGRNLASPPLDWGLTATFRDINADLAPDLYVCNDYWTPDRFWLNDGRGHFRAVPLLALRKTSASSMSVDFADIDRDGYRDFFTVDMLSRDPALRKREAFAQMPAATPIGTGEDRPQVMRNALFLNRHDGTFAEIACFAQVPASDWSWAPVFLDVDLDGYEDLVIGAGYFRDVQDYDAGALIQARQHRWDGFKSDAERQQAFTRELMEHYHLYPRLEMPIIAFQNLHDCTFQETTDDWGLNHLGVHQGLALADFDQDGDLDLVVNNLNAPATLFRNDTAAGRVAVTLKGQLNTQGIGAKISLLDGAVPKQTTEVVCGGRYQSGSDTEVVFAAGSSASAMILEVIWRNGRRSRVQGVLPNRIYQIDETVSEPFTVRPAPPESPMFADATPLISHQHHETEYDDYQRQPLLPFKLSQLGPGVAWFDLDGDGHDELIIGAGRGGSPVVLRTDGRGSFMATPTNAALAVPNDTAGMVGWEDRTGGRALLVGLSGYEAKSDHAAAIFRWATNRLAEPATFASEISTGGALALGEMSGDGQLALFVAGGVLPGQYPLGAPSKLYRWDGRQWRLDLRNSGLLSNLGIVNGAVWSDLDGDGLPELILACEWGPIRVFRNRSGALFEVTEELGLKPDTGWWRGVTTADLDNDGRLDIVASNWGLNSPYRATDKEPLVFAYGQMAQPGVMDIVETEYARGTLTPRRQFAPLVTAVPFLHERFSTHQAFSEASLDDFLGDRKVLSRRVNVTTLSSTLFLNTGRAFKAVAMPREAQFSPAFSVNVADLDGDGNEDVFLSQNFFDVQPEIARLDAGLGLWLRGDGQGHLEAVPSARSGILVFGEQRGAALGDYDEDGRVDLVLTQNGAATRLFHNVGAAPGLRVRLKGSPGNPAGIGAVLRLRFRDRLGPARELHAGSGYWSQDSLTQVLATPTAPESLQIRWPGGRVTSTAIPAQAKEITVDREGRLVPSR